MAYRHHAYSERGFSVVEACVIVAIGGLFIATIIGGKDLIRTATLRQMITETKEYAWQVDTFKAFYQGLPGDLKNATQFWPNSDGGDGNGLVDVSDHENYRVWEHLMLTRLIDGTYDGTSQLPVSPLRSRASYRIEEQPYQVYGTKAGTMNGIHIHGENGWYGAISSVDAKDVDTKMDDGVASTGKLVGYSDNQNGCAKTESGQNAAMDYNGVAQYNAQDNTLVCALTYWIAAK